jgi:hypothetical protein
MPKAKSRLAPASLQTLALFKLPASVKTPRAPIERTCFGI